MRITTIGIDADDTIWHNESRCQEIYDLHHEILRRLRPDLVDPEAQLLKVERKNLGHYGYGTKGLMLSVIESVLEVTANNATGDDIARIMGVYHRHLQEPIKLIDGVAETLTALAVQYRLILITKGDFIEQTAKINAADVNDLFSAIHIVPEKDTLTYDRVLKENGVLAREFLMVGNSVRSDIIPVVTLGGSAVHIPYHLTWEHEQAPSLPSGEQSWQTLERFTDLPKLLSVLSNCERREPLGQ